MGGTGLSMKRRSVAVAGGRGKKSLNFQRLRPNNGISNENARQGEREKWVWQLRLARGLNTSVSIYNIHIYI